MRRQAAAVGEIGRDFVRREADSPAQLDVGQSFLAQVKDGLEADAEVFRNFLRRPQVLGRVLDFLGNRRVSERAVI